MTANAIFDYLEIFHNRRRRHSALGVLMPIEYELRNSKIEPVHEPTVQHPDSGKPRAHQRASTKPAVVHRPS